MAKGRPPRAGERATERCEFRMTLAESRSVRALAEARQCSVADLIRLTVLDAAEEAGERPTLILGQTLLSRIVSGNNSREGSR